MLKKLAQGLLVAAALAGTMSAHARAQMIDMGERGTSDRPAAREMRPAPSPAPENLERQAGEAFKERARGQVMHPSGANTIRELWRQEQRDFGVPTSTPPRAEPKPAPEIRGGLGRGDAP